MAVFDESLGPSDIENLQLRFNGSAIAAATVASIPSPRYVRMAFLTDNNPFSLFASSTAGTSSFSFPSAINEASTLADGSNSFLSSQVGVSRAYRYFDIVWIATRYGNTAGADNFEDMSDVILDDRDPAPLTLHENFSGP